MIINELRAKIRFIIGVNLFTLINKTVRNFITTRTTSVKTVIEYGFIHYSIIHHRLPYSVSIYDRYS